MKRATRLLLVILIAEVVVGGCWLLLRRPRIAPTIPVLDGYPLWTQQKLKTAVEECRPDVAADWNRLADTSFATGFYREAEACYRRSTELLPSDPQLRYNLAYCLSSIGDQTGSDHEFLAAIEHGHPRPDDCRYFIGRSALRDGNIADAKRAFEQSSRLPASQLELAILAIGEQDYATAAQLLQGLKEKYPNAWSVQQNLARLADWQGDAEESQKHAALADVLRDHLTGPWHNRGKTIQDMSRSLSVEGQVNHLRQLLSVGSTKSANAEIVAANEVLWDPELEDIQSDVDYAAGHVNEQISRLQHVIDLDGANAWRLGRLGLAQLAAQDTESAIRSLETGIHLLSGKSGTDTIGLCQVLADLRRAEDPDAARRISAQGMYLQGIEFLDELAVAQAAEALAKSVELDPAPSQSWFWLGRTRQLLGEREAAIAAFDECLKRNPYHERAMRNRQVLQRADDK
jgi:tetratricopeptide (TPR) repeat protein